MRYFGIHPDFSGGETLGESYAKINEIIKDVAKKNNLSLWQMDYVWYVIKEIKKDEIEDEIDENGRIESIRSSACLTAYDDINLKISKEWNAWLGR